jgi:hypothetical protein
LLVFHRGDPVTLRLRLRSVAVVGPDGVAAVAIHLMANTALTGATYDIDGGHPARLVM